MNVFKLCVSCVRIYFKPCRSVFNYTPLKATYIYDTKKNEITVFYD